MKVQAEIGTDRTPHPSHPRGSTLNEAPFLSHHCLSGTLDFAPGRCRGLPGELAEAGRPAPHPLPLPLSVGALRQAGREGAVAAWDGGALSWGGAGILGEEALNELELFLFLLQEHVHQELLLPFELLHDGFRHVGDDPGYHQAEEHHQILEKTAIHSGKCQNVPVLRTICHRKISLHMKKNRAQKARLKLAQHVCSQDVVNSEKRTGPSLAGRWSDVFSKRAG